MVEPSAPDADSREALLDELAALVARGGAAPLLARPVIPGPDAFPEPWAPTRPGVALLLRRLAWHAGLDREIELEDRRARGAPPTERMPATCVELFELRRHHAVFALGLIGRDDVPGTLAHEIGVAYAALHRPDEADPYRTAEPPAIAIDPDRDLERGSIATVYLGLGVLAANAAFQQYSRTTGAYGPLEYDILRAGSLPMSALAYLLAVQAAVRGEAVPPPGLEPPQRDEVVAWIEALRGRAGALRERLGIAADAAPGERPDVVPFEVSSLEDDATRRATAFRWNTNRGGVGLLAGALLGVGVAMVVASRGLAPILVIGTSAAGHVVGRRVRVPRCSGCASILPRGDAPTCRVCGAVLRGEIAHLSERLEAEERLDEPGSESST